MNIHYETKTELVEKMEALKMLREDFWPTIERSVK